MRSVFVGNPNELANLSGYQPGSIAYTAGFKKMWHLNIDANVWVGITADTADIPITAE